jgi:NADPH:quinone reductase-like Zn-dependent oxidoreductase
MKAIVYRKYGSPDVLQMEEVEKPAPDENQVLVKVHAASINAGDYRSMNPDAFLIRLMSGLLKPKKPRLGWDLSGRVEAVGKNIKQLRPMDEVFGCSNGTFAEYVLAKEDRLTLKPANKSFEEAAALPVAALTALQGLRDAAGIRPPGQKILIQGASGGVGTFAVQFAKSFGAEVTAVCSTRNLDMARSIGADHVIDYTKEDFTQSPPRYDVIFAVNGYHPLSDYKRALSPQGIYICAGGAMSQFFQAMLLGPLLSRKGGKKMGSMGVAKINQKDLAYLGELLAAGKITPVIDRRYSLSEIVEAFRYVEDTHAQGKVVITMV